MSADDVAAEPPAAVGKAVAKHTIYNLVGQALPLGLGLVTIPLYLHLIGPDRFGVLSIAWLLLGYFGLFDLGLGFATSFRIAALSEAAPADRARTFWTALAVNAGMGAVGGVVLWGAAGALFSHVFKMPPQLRPEMMQALPFLAAAVPIATVSGVLGGALQGRQKFLALNSVSVLTTLLFQVIPVLVALAYGPDLPMLLGSAVMARVFSLGALSVLCHREVTRGQPITFSRGEAKALLSYGGWITVSAMFGPIMATADRFLIGAVLGSQAVATYTVPFQLTQRIAIFPHALMNALFPKMVSAPTEDHGRMGDAATLTLATLLSLPVLVGILIMGPFLQIWVGPAMAQAAAPVGRLLLIAYWINAFACVPFFAIQAAGNPRMVALIHFVEIPFFLVGLYFGLKDFGLIGCALVLCGRYAVDWLLMTLGARSGFRPLPMLLANLALLCAGVYVASRPDALSPAMLAVAATVALTMLVIGWMSLPLEIKRRLAHEWARLSRRGAPPVNPPIPADGQRL
jgi:O-antigen/teichoic acid export membrane protein